MTNENQQPEWEYGFDVPSQVGVKFVTTNEMLVEVLSAARPEAPVYCRPATPWTEVTR